MLKLNYIPLKSFCAILTSALASALILTTSLSAAPPAPYGALPSKAQLKWHKLEQYAFCHFTINTFTGREWGYGDEDPKLFNPSDTDVDQIVKAAKDAGMKGFILTCKHHDGFCLWPTKTTKHNISKSPYKNGKGDLVKEFSESAKRHGLKFGFYVSPWDRNSEHYGKPEYIKQFRAQLTELLTNYGPAFEVWFDGANGGDGYYGGARTTRRIDRLTYYDWPTTFKLVKKLQPNAVIFSDIGPGVRWIGNERGVANYPCWATSTPQGKNGNPASVGAMKYRLNTTGTVNGKFWIPGECDVSIRPHWFYRKNEDGKVRTPKNLLNLYFASVGRGASFLLNLAPDRRGQLHANDIYSLETYGKLIEQMFSKNYADGAKATATIVRENGKNKAYSAANVLDGDRHTYWATPDKTKSASLTLELAQASTFDVIRLREPIKLGQRIRKFTIEVRSNGNWITWQPNGSSIGAHTLLRGKPVTADAVRVNITHADACPLLSEISLWKQPGTTPDSLPIPKVANEIPRENWKITATMDSNDNPAKHAIDGNPRTIWATHNGTPRKHDVPQSLTIDMGRKQTIAAIEVLPRQDGTAHAVIDRYELIFSNDGKTWSKPIKGEFSNIRANPIYQTIELKAPVQARYLKFTGTRVLEKNNVTVAEIRVLKPPVKK